MQPTKHAKLNLTDTVIKLLRYVNANAGCLGTSVPHNLRKALRTAEDMDLIIYSSSGWRITPKGRAQL